MIENERRRRRVGEEKSRPEATAGREPARLAWCPARVSRLWLDYGDRASGLATLA